MSVMETALQPVCGVFVALSTSVAVTVAPVTNAPVLSVNPVTVRSWNGHESVHWARDLLAPSVPGVNENYVSSNSRTVHARTYSFHNPYAFSVRAGRQFRLIVIAPAHGVQIRWVDRA